MIRKILIIWLLAINVIVNWAYAQDYSELRQYTIADGLPSNYIYDLVEDNNGFLWIATDNGVSRFDGKYFKNFSIKDGLPSYDAVNIRRDGQGKIWVNCYQQNPVYFDESNNKFIKIKEYAIDSSMRKGLLNMYNTENGGIEFNSNGGQWQFKNLKLFKYSNIQTFEDGKIKVSLVYYKSNINKLNYDVFLNTKNKIILQKLKNQLTNTVNNLRGKRVDNYLYLFDVAIINQLSNFSIKHNTFTKKILNCVEQINDIKILENELHVNGFSGNIYIYDLQTFKLKNTILSTKGTTNAVFDKQNNLWIATIDEGLKLFGKKKIKNLDFLNTKANPNFICISSNEKGEIFAGNYYGQIVNIKSKQIIDIGNGSRKNWIRE